MLKTSIGNSGNICFKSKRKGSRHHLNASINENFNDEIINPGHPSRDLALPWINLNFEPKL